MKRPTHFFALIVGLTAAAPFSARAADDAALARMESRIEALEHELADLKAEHRAFVQQHQAAPPQAAQQVPPVAAQPQQPWQQALVNRAPAPVNAPPEPAT